MLASVDSSGCLGVTNVRVTQFGSYEKITQTCAPFISIDWWRGERFFTTSGRLENVDILSHDGGCIGKGWIEGDDERCTVCVAC